MSLEIAIFALGLVMLVVGADLFVKGAGGIALRFGVSAFVVGMTLVGFGTSVPEMAVNLTAVLEQRLDLAVGNIVGSNIANVGLILGVSAMVVPLAVGRRILRIEMPILLLACVGFWLLAMNGSLGRLDATLLLAGFAALMVFIVRSARDQPAEVTGELGVDEASARSATWPHLWRLALGFVLMVLGSKLMIDSAVGLATRWGVSELVIGLTIVAVGTSLPELAASVMAAIRGQAEIAVGNVIGSCLFNLLLILGVTAAVTPVPVAASLVWIEIPLMMALVLVLYPLSLRRGRIGRGGAGLLLASFAAFVAWQYLGVS